MSAERFAVLVKTPDGLRRCVEGQGVFRSKQQAEIIAARMGELARAKGWLLSYLVVPAEDVPKVTPPPAPVFTVRTQHLLDDGWNQMGEMKFSTEKEALDWGRSTLATYLELGEPTLAISISKGEG